MKLRLKFNVKWTQVFLRNSQPKKSHVLLKKLKMLNYLNQIKHRKLGKMCLKKLIPLYNREYQKLLQLSQEIHLLMFQRLRFRLRLFQLIRRLYPRLFLRAVLRQQVAHRAVAHQAVQRLRLNKN